MGWTSYHATHYKNGKVDKKKEMDEHFSSSGLKVLKSSMVGNVYYAAVEQNRGTREVFGIICLVSTINSKYYNIFYKDMDETCGPNYYDCPVGILDLLTPTDNSNANTWRRLCWEKHEKKRKKRNDPNSLNNLPDGAVISFMAKCELTAGGKPYKRAGDEVLLTKIVRRTRTGRRSCIWRDNACNVRWTSRQIPADYEVKVS